VGRIAGICAALACVATAAGCGEEPAGSLGTPLAYFPADSGAVAVVSTDLDSSRYSELNGAVGEQLFDGKGLKDTLRDEVEHTPRITFGDVEKVLGNDLVVGTTSRQGLLPGRDRYALAALELRDVSKFRDLLERLANARLDGKSHGADLYRLDGEVSVAIDGKVAVAGRREVVVASLERARQSTHLTEAQFEAATANLPRDDALVRGYGNLRGLFEHRLLSRFSSVKWVRALRTGGLAVSLDGEKLVLDAAANTDVRAITAADLPLVEGNTPPPLPSVPERVTSASANQSQTTVFLLRAFRAAYPRSRFVRDVASIEHDLRINFEREVLRQFNGRSASELDLSGGFAARSAVRSPARMRALLPRLVPRLPQLVQDLDGLHGTGRALLLLFAPDAPVATTAASGGVRVQPAPAPGSQLYRVSGLKGEGPHEIVLGLVGDVFVVASDEQRARAIATAPVEPAPPGSRGAAVAAADFSRVASGPLVERLGLSTSELGASSGWLEASTARLRAHAEFELRLGP
jgi:hypothetical protein